MAPTEEDKDESQRGPFAQRMADLHLKLCSSLGTMCAVLFLFAFMAIYLPALGVIGRVDLPWLTGDPGIVL